MAQAARIFVSHAHEDTPWCRTFVQALRDAGADVWYDEHDLGDGVISEEIERELQARPMFIVLLSPASMVSPQVQREVRAAIDLRDTAGPTTTTRTMLLVMAEQTDVPGLWADFQRVSGPGDRGISAPEAARRALATLALAPALAPAYTSGEAPVAASSVPARKGTAYRRGPRTPNRGTGELVALLVLVAVSVSLLALVWQLSALVTRPLVRNMPNNLDPLVGGAPKGITTGPDGALWFTESQGNQIGRITTSGQLRDFPLPTLHLPPTPNSTLSSSPEGIRAGSDEALGFTKLVAIRWGRSPEAGASCL
jgi:hypothetical protein